MTGRRLTEIARGLVYLCALAALAIGPPAALVSLVGWPLPTELPTLDQIGDALRVGISDQVVVKTLALLAWLIWTQIAIAIATETVAVLRGRASHRLPVMPGIQATVGRLVAGVTLIGSTTLSGAHFPASAAPASDIAPIVLVSDVANDTPTLPELPQAPPEPAPPVTSAAPASTTIEVQPHDSYWAIAERVYGDGLRWREIRDANVGRHMPGGRVIEASSDVVRAGWVLTVPGADAADHAPTDPPLQPPPPPTPFAEVEVAPGDSFWRLAEKHLTEVLGRSPTDEETAAHCAEMVELNRDRLVDTNNADLIYPGQTFLRPTSAVPVAGPTPVEEHPPPADEPEPPTSPPGTSPTTATVPDTDSGVTPPEVPRPTTTTPPPTSPATTHEPAPSPVPSTETPTDNEDERPVIALVGAASAALAVGLTAAIRRRRRQRNHLAPRQVPLPSSDTELHRELIAAADEEAVTDVATSLNLLARSLAETDSDSRPLIVQHGDGRTDILLDHPTPSDVDGWTRVDDGALLTASVLTSNADGQTNRWSSPAPLLVALGRPDADGQIYIDLEAAGVTTLTGDEVTCLDLLRSFATEAAHSPLTETTQVYVVGSLGIEALFDESDRITVVEDWDDVLDELNSWTTQSHEALAATGRPNAFVARTEDPDDDTLVPLLVLGAEPPPSPDALAFLTQESATSAAAVVIADTPLERSTIIECRPGELQLPQLGLACIPEALSEERAERIANLLTTASDPAGTQLDLGLLVEVGDNGNGSEPVQEPGPVFEDQPYEVLVRLLGDVRVEGSLRRGLDPKEVSAVAFVALMSPVTVDKVEDALWAAPRTNTRRRRLIDLMSQCRSAVREQHLPKAKDGYYTVGPLLKTDTQLFESRVEAAADQPTWEDSADLRLSALSLCTGPVFHTQQTASDSFAWIEASNLTSHWELRLTALAEDLADDCLAHDDVGRAIKACEAGLRAMRTHAGCTEALMRAHAQSGNLDAVQRVYQAHVTALELIHLDHAAESTSDLYKQLVGSP